MALIPDGRRLFFIPIPELQNRHSSLILPAITGDIDKFVEPHDAGACVDCMDLAVLAAANGQVAVLRALRALGYPLAKATSRLLPLAAANGRVSILEYLVAQGCEITLDDNAAIRAAVSKSHLGAVRFLHQHGADIAGCEDAARALAANDSSEPLLQYLASHGVYRDGPTVMKVVRAIRSRDLEATRAQFRDFDVAPNAALLLLVAAETGNANIVAFLHESGCDIRAEEDLPLRIAAGCGHLALTRMLHERGADIHARDEEALKWAAENAHFDVVKYLVEQGAQVTRLEPQSASLIVLNGDTAVFHYLTDGGFDSIRDDRVAIDAMRAELYSAKPVYRPSKLWEFFNDLNMEQLRLGGLPSFKRSINQNYFNFVPYSLLDPQLRKLMWWWLFHPTLTPFRIRVVDPDVDPQSGALYPVQRRVFRLNSQRPFVAYLAREVQLDLYGWLVSLLWDYVASHDRMGLLDRIAEPRVGTPLESYHQGRLVSQDLAHSVLECNAILGEIEDIDASAPLRIAEVGAGYGRLGYVLLHAKPCRYFVFDIPPSLYVSQWYLAALFPAKRIFRFRHFERFEEIVAELAECDIAFFSANQIELIPDGYFDITINISSLHELRPDQIDNMLGQIYRITRSFLYLKQYKEYINPYDGLRILENNYKLAPGWRYRYYRTDRVDGRFFETLIQSPRAGLPASREEPPQPLPRGTRAGMPARHTVSVLLATYNHAEYLPTSLAGICNQSRPADEIIIVDDGSTDDTVGLVGQFAARHGNIRLIRNTRNRGQHYSIQKALLAATGDYIVWASADDLLLPQFLERSCGQLNEHPGAGICFSRLAVFGDGEQGTRSYTEQSHGAAFDYGTAPRYLTPAEIARILGRHYLWISGNTVVARRSALLDLGGFERSLRWHADWLAYYAVALRYGACMIPETLALMRERRGTYSGSGIQSRDEQDRVLKAILDAFHATRFADIGPIMRRSPSLLSPFGKRIVKVAYRNPAHWLLATRLLVWHGKRHLAARYGRLRYRLSAAYHRTPGLVEWCDGRIARSRQLLFSVLSKVKRRIR